MGDKKLIGLGIYEKGRGGKNIQNLLIVKVKFIIRREMGEEKSCERVKVY